jgi:hypothetical protein
MSAPVTVPAVPNLRSMYFPNRDELSFITA